MRVLDLRSAATPQTPLEPEARGAPPEPSPAIQWIGRTDGVASVILAAFGRGPHVVLADPGSAPTAARLAAWHRAALLIEAGGERVSARVPKPWRRAARVIAADSAQRDALVAAGVEAGRVLVIVPGSPPADPAHGPITQVGSRDDAVREGFRIARGRAIRRQPTGVYRVVKRLFDLAVGLTLALLLMPLLLLVALAIKLDSPGPVLFRQRRIGRATSEFTIMKFRTMFTGTPDLASHLMGPGSSRVTRVGRWLRRTSIDELPQLWHIVTGEMSLVGPRPALHNQYDLIGLRQQAGIDALKPGITGWAQVNGRDDIPLEQKVGFDRHYLEHVSVAHDLEILVRTATVLFSDRGTF
jgi:O-antigen biosynthesis protein WbqP